MTQVVTQTLPETATPSKRRPVQPAVLQAQYSANRISTLLTLPAPKGSCAATPKTVNGSVFVGVPAAPGVSIVPPLNSCIF